MPLHHAVDHENGLFVYSLLAEDALNPDVTNKDGLTSLDSGVRNEDRRMEDLLLTREDIQVVAGRHKSRLSLGLAARRGILAYF